MRLKKMALGTVLLSGLAGAAFGQPGRDNHNDNNRAPQNSSRPGPEQRPVENRESIQIQRPASQQDRLQQAQDRQNNQRPTPTVAHVDYRVNNNPRSVETNPIIRVPNNQSVDHHTGDRRPSVPVQVGGNIKFQNPNHGRTWRNDNGSGFNNHFSFGLYLFSPDVEACYVSPWYDYGALPGYVPASSVIVDQSDNCQWSQGSVYSCGDISLDQTVTEIQNIFLNKDQNALNVLIPQSQNVGIYTDGGYDYSVSATQFQQLLSDNSMNVDTIGYRVTQIRTNGNQVIVEAQHTVADPNGGEDVVYQLFHLQNEDGQYVVTDFMTSHDAI